MESARIDALAAGYRQGRDTDLGPLVETLARPLLSLAHRYLRDWDLAADLVQDTWLRVVTSIAHYDPRRPFLPWVQTILRNLCLQHLEREARRPVAVPLGVIAEPPTSRPGEDPDRQVAAADLRRALARHLVDLGESQRRALVMVDLEQRDREEVARELGLTPASLRVILCRARRAVAGRLVREELS